MALFSNVVADNVATDNIVAETVATDPMDADFGKASRRKLAEQHRLDSQRILEEMAQVQIVLNEAGLTLIAPERNTWKLDDIAVGFADMPEAFVRSHLQLRLRNFLYETFCLSDDSVHSARTVSSESSNPEGSNSEALGLGSPNLGAPNLINDRVGGGIHVGLLEQFKLSNQGKGYFDPGWEVVRAESDGAIAVQKHGIIVHIDPLRHLPAETHETQAERQVIQSGDWLAIRLPGYRFEPNFYIAIGDQGPVIDIDQAQEIYFAATDAAMPLIMKILTTALNGDLLNGKCAIPYTLQVPYEPEGYEGPEAIVLRIEKADFDQVLPLLQQIWELCSQTEISSPPVTAQSATAQSGTESNLLRSELPVFAYPLWPGISMADVIEGSATEWFSSSAELSRMHLVAEALTQVWYESLAEEPGTQVSPSQNLLAMQAQFSQAQLSWEQPFNRAWNRRSEPTSP
jgi:hypothetical protein